MDGARTLLFERITGCKSARFRRIDIKEGGRELIYVIDIRELTANHNV